MARKAKKKVHAMPKLSLLDKCIYWLLLVIAMLPAAGCIYVAYGLRNRIAFADPAVAAATEHISIGWFLPSFIWLFSVPLGLWTDIYGKRYPIFGIRGFQYGPPAWPRIYPVFMKDKPKFWKSPKKKQDQKKMVILLLVLTAIFTLPTFLSFQGRDVLYADGRVASYNMFGVCTEEVDKPYIESVEFGVYSRKGGKYSSRSYGVDMTLRTTGAEEYYFRSHDFRWDWDADVRPWITLMLQLKEVYADRVAIEESAGWDRVLDGSGLSDQEIALLRKLLEISQ